MIIFIFVHIYNSFKTTEGVKFKNEPKWNKGNVKEYKTED